MKKLYLFVFIILFSFTKINAQYFVGDVTLSGNVAIFSVKPQGGNITGKIAVLEYYLRWATTEGNSFTFTNFINNDTDFPGMDMLTTNNDATDPGYNNQHFVFVGLTATKTYLDGVSYEVFRVTLGGVIPAQFQLVADNTTYLPYYFNVAGDGAIEYSPKIVNAFVGGTNGGGDFWYKSISLTPLAIKLTSFSGTVADCNANLVWTTTNEVNNDHFEIQYSSDAINFETLATVASSTNSSDAGYKKSVPLASAFNYYRLKIVSKSNETEYSNIILLRDKNCSNITEMAVLVTPNPVINHEIRMQVTMPKADNLDIQVTELSGKVMGQYTRKVIAGKNQVIIQLPLVASSQYIVSIHSGNNGHTEQKIFVE